MTVGGTEPPFHRETYYDGGENPYTDDELPYGLRRTFMVVDESVPGYFATLPPLDKDLQDWLKDGSATDEAEAI